MAETARFWLRCASEETPSVIGLFAGAVLGGLFAAGRSREKLAAAQARAEERDAANTREKETLNASLAKMEAIFKGLAAESLEHSNKSFLGLATERMKPLEEKLGALQKETQAMEAKRSEAYGSLRSELESLQSATLSLQQQSTALTTALRGSSQTRGQLGELALHNIVRFAGMTRHCDFFEQKEIYGGGRPDMVVKLPGGGLIPIDSKFPGSAFMDAMQENDPKLRDAKLLQHASDLNKHVKELKRRDYAADLDGEVDFTVLFLPGDHLLAAAYEQNPELQEKALADRILIATPVTLVALLRTVGLYWKQHDLAENAREIQKQAETLHKRVLDFFAHLAGIGKHLGQALDSYNRAVGSYERRVLPAGRQLEQMNATRGEFPELPQVEKPLRALPAGLPFAGAEGGEGEN